ncbi:MAG: hypothetical protein CMD23_04420 [Flavobacteriales bacterium]|nr:hypothetical protein [Flavobacteriales bacterium]
MRIVCFFLFPLFLFSQNNLIDANDNKQGYWKLYFPYSNDSIVSEEGFFLDNQEHGLWVKYHENGQVRELLNYRNGKLDGVRVAINKRGKLIEQEFFKDGGYHGIQKYYHDNGRISLESSYVLGDRHGLFVKYYRNGKKQESVNYLTNQKHGLAQWYFDNEQLSIQYMYNHGLIVDTAYAFYKTGEIKSKSIYSSNELNGEKISFFPSGIVKEIGGFLNGKKHDNWCTYDSLGNELNCVKYKRGKKL